MIVTDGYSIEYYKNANKIVIKLPPTMETVTDTIMALSTDRKSDFTDTELGAILLAVKSIAERR